MGIDIQVVCTILGNDLHKYDSQDVFSFDTDFRSLTMKRYRKHRIIKKEGIRKFRNCCIPINNADITDTYIITQQGDRLDNLAYMGILQRPITLVDTCKS